MMAYGKTEINKERANDAGLEQVTIWLREDLIGELEAINQYQAHIDKIDNEEVRELLEHIRDDEKEHVAEITHLLARIDVIQREKFAEDHTVAPEERVVREAPHADEKIATIGNMFGKK
jgi:rubrerythrin